MGRMLKALQQIETVRPAPPDRSTPSEPVRGPSAMEATLARAETALAAEQDAGRPAPAEPDCGPAERPPARESPDVPTPPPQVASEFHELANAILAQLPSSKSAVAMLVSPDGEGGDPAAILSLAAALRSSVSGAVAIIDCDLRSPERFGGHGRYGLIDILRSRVPWHEAAYLADPSGIAVLPGRGYDSDEYRKDRLGLQLLLDELEEHFQIILLDATSLPCAEASAVSSYCDGTYLVIRINHTSRQSAKRAVRTVARAGGQVLGCVLLVN